MKQPYAARTQVTSDKTRSEIDAVLGATKASRIVTMDEVAEMIVGFVLDGRWYKVVVPVPLDASDQARRAKWRALLLVIKAKLEAVMQGISTIEQEFLAATIMPNGQTVHDWLGPQIAVAYERGEMPKLLPDYSGPRP